MRYHLRMIDYKHEYLLNIIKVDLRNLQPPDFKQVKKCFDSKLEFTLKKLPIFQLYLFSFLIFFFIFYSLQRANCLRSVHVLLVYITFYHQKALPTLPFFL